jgi:hypothetical protein
LIFNVLKRDDSSMLNANIHKSSSHLTPWALSTTVGNRSEVLHGFIPAGMEVGSEFPQKRVPTTDSLFKRLPPSKKFGSSPPITSQSSFKTSRNSSFSASLLQKRCRRQGPGS